MIPPAAMIRHMASGETNHTVPCQSGVRKHRDLTLVPGLAPVLWGMPSARTARQRAEESVIPSAMPSPPPVPGSGHRWWVPCVDECWLDGVARRRATGSRYPEHPGAARSPPARSPDEQPPGRLVSPLAGRLSGRSHVRTPRAHGVGPSIVGPRHPARSTCSLAVGLQRSPPASDSEPAAIGSMPGVAVSNTRPGIDYLVPGLFGFENGSLFTASSALSVLPRRKSRPRCVGFTSLGLAGGRLALPDPDFAVRVSLDLGRVVHQSGGSDARVSKPRLRSTRPGHSRQITEYAADRVTRSDQASADGSQPVPRARLMVASVGPAMLASILHG